MRINYSKMVVFAGRWGLTFFVAFIILFPLYWIVISSIICIDNIRGKSHYAGTYLALITRERYWRGEGERLNFIWMVIRNILQYAEQELKIILEEPGVLMNNMMNCGQKQLIRQPSWVIRIIPVCNHQRNIMKEG